MEKNKEKNNTTGVHAFGGRNRIRTDKSSALRRCSGSIENG